MALLILKAWQLFMQIGKRENRLDRGGLNVNVNEALNEDTDNHNTPRVPWGENRDDVEKEELIGIMGEAEEVDSLGMSTQVENNHVLLSMDETNADRYDDKIAANIDVKGDDKHAQSDSGVQNDDQVVTTSDVEDNLNLMETDSEEEGYDDNMARVSDAGSEDNKVTTVLEAEGKVDQYSNFLEKEGNDFATVKVVQSYDDLIEMVESTENKDNEVEKHEASGDSQQGNDSSISDKDVLEDQELIGGNFRNRENQSGKVGKSDSDHFNKMKNRKIDDSESDQLDENLIGISDHSETETLPNYGKKIDEIHDFIKKLHKPEALFSSYGSDIKQTIGHTIQIAGNTISGSGNEPSSSNTTSTGDRVANSDSGLSLNLTICPNANTNQNIAPSPSVGSVPNIRHAIDVRSGSLYNQQAINQVILQPVNSHSGDKHNSSDGRDDDSSLKHQVDTPSPPPTPVPDLGYKHSRSEGKDSDNKASSSATSDDELEAYLSFDDQENETFISSLSREQDKDIQDIRILDCTVVCLGARLDVENRTNDKIIGIIDTSCSMNSTMKLTNKDAYVMELTLLEIVQCAIKEIMKKNPLEAYRKIGLMTFDDRIVIHCKNKLLSVKPDQFKKEYLQKVGEQLDVEQWFSTDIEYLTGLIHSVNTEDDTGTMTPKKNFSIGEANVTKPEEVSNLVNTEKVSNVVNTQEVSNVVNTKEVSNVVNTKEVSNVVNTQEVSNAVNTQEVSNVVNTQEVSNVVNTQEVSNLVNTEEVSNLVNTQEVSNVVNTQEVSNLVKTQEVSNVVNTQEVSNVVNTQEVSNSVNTEEGSNLVNTEEGSNLVNTEEVLNLVNTQEVSNLVNTEEVSNLLNTEEGSNVVNTEEVSNMLNAIRLALNVNQTLGGSMILVFPDIKRLRLIQEFQKKGEDVLNEINKLAIAKQKTVAIISFEQCNLTGIDTSENKMTQLSPLTDILTPLLDRIESVMIPANAERKRLQMQQKTYAQLLLETTKVKVGEDCFETLLIKQDVEDLPSHFCFKFENILNSPTRLGQVQFSLNWTIYVYETVENPLSDVITKLEKAIKDLGNHGENLDDLSETARRDLNSSLNIQDTVRELLDELRRLLGIMDGHNSDFRTSITRISETNKIVFNDFKERLSASVVTIESTIQSLGSKIYTVVMHSSEGIEENNRKLSFEISNLQTIVEDFRTTLLAVDEKMVGKWKNIEKTEEMLSKTEMKLSETEKNFQSKLEKLIETEVKLEGKLKQLETLMMNLLSESSSAQQSSFMNFGSYFILQVEDGEEDFITFQINNI